MNELDIFVEKMKKGRKTKGGFKLPQYKETIKELREKGLTFSEIKEYLETKEVHVSTSSISRFYNRNFGNKMPNIQTDSQNSSKPEIKAKKSYNHPSWAPDDLDLSPEKLL